MEELKPCPFCGSEAETGEGRIERWYVHCSNNDCPIQPMEDWFATEEQAITAWNTRAERTCKMEWHYSDPGGNAYTCSCCGMDAYPFNRNFKRCQNCGAKVVE